MKKSQMKQFHVSCTEGNCFEGDRYGSSSMRLADFYSWKEPFLGGSNA